MRINNGGSVYADAGDNEYGFVSGRKDGKNRKGQPPSIKNYQ
jgi:hypothetical protein